jgi:hypothetical protein
LDEVFIGQYDLTNTSVFGVGSSSEATVDRLVVKIPWEINTFNPNVFNARSARNISDPYPGYEDLCCGEPPKKTGFP